MSKNDFDGDDRPYINLDVWGTTHSFLVGRSPEGNLELALSVAARVDTVVAQYAGEDYTVCRGVATEIEGLPFASFNLTEDSTTAEIAAALSAFVGFKKPEKKIGIPEPRSTQHLSWL